MANGHGQWQLSRVSVKAMSLVVFPFKTEDPNVVLTNIRIAASHPAVGRVLAVGFEQESTFEAVARSREEIGRETSTPIDLVLQHRIGDMRPGKGDGMNTGLRYFLSETDAERIHFYDADITSFGPEWITQAERGADLGYDAVRHFFPRSSTDAMITWMITRTGFALLWPRSELPRIEQPLGGELLFSRSVTEALVADDRVQAQSNWGIDTLYTFATVQSGFSVYETYVEQGKAHALYGGLTDLKTMLVECFAAIQALRGEKVTKPINHQVEATASVPSSITEKVGYNIEATLRMPGQRWNERQVELLGSFSDEVQQGVLENRKSATFAFMDEEAWAETYSTLLESFTPGDDDWEELLFKLWVIRVLNYTTARALRGYEHSQEYLRSTISGYTERAVLAE
jgi:mannosylglycerate synthase